MSKLEQFVKRLGVYYTKSGEKINLRLIHKEDAGLLVDLFHHLSAETKRLRFHLYTEKLPEERVWQEAIVLSNLDPQRHVAIVATITEADGQEHAVGVARFARETIEDKEAEVAVVVRDDFQRKGVGKHLLNTLAEQARKLGLTHLAGWVMAENIRLMKLIRSLEIPVETETPRYGERKVRVPLYHFGEDHMHYSFEGNLTEKQVKQHLIHAFELPPHSSQFYLHFQFSPARVKNIRNMLCLTLFDPQGFRGAGHRGGNDHIVYISSNQATPGYRPGALPAGPWAVEIDTHMIMPGEPCHYKLDITITTAPGESNITPELAQAKAILPASRGPGWYRGDLHTHTRHSDGQQDATSLVETARQLRLDFVTLTDHNTVSGLAEMEQLSRPELLTLAGLELTTYWGHALCLGARQWIDWRVGLGQRNMADIAGEVTANDQLFIIAHPRAVGDPVCTGCDWRYEEMQPGVSQFVEIWNGPWSGDSNNEQAISLWYEWLNQGHHLVATAGSDAHRPEDYTDEQGFNIIYAEDLSEAALFQALRAGHLYLSAGPHLSLTGSTQDGQKGLMGDALPAREVTLTVEWQDCPATARLRLIAGGQALAELPTGQSGSHRWSLSSTQAHWGVVEVRSETGQMLAITNPIFLSPK